jgi:hypothetical protein
LQLLPKQMRIFFAVEHIGVLIFGFGCWGETAEGAKNVMFPWDPTKHPLRICIRFDQALWPCLESVSMWATLRFLEQHRGLQQQRP